MEYNTNIMKIMITRYDVKNMLNLRILSTGADSIEI